MKNKKHFFWRQHSRKWHFEFNENLNCKDHTIKIGVTGESMTSTAEVIKEFQNVTGADADTSKFYLESSGWDISV